MNSLIMNMHTVYHSSQKTNHIENKPCSSRPNLPRKANKKYAWQDDTSEIFWSHVGEEIVKLVEILSDKNKETTSSA